jgi:hypothetical protein
VISDWEKADAGKAAVLGFLSADSSFPVPASGISEENPSDMSSSFRI